MRSTPCLVPAFAAALSLFAAACACGPAPEPVPEPPPQGTILVQGVVVDASELPVEGAQVEAGGQATRSGADGRFAVSVPPDAAPTLQVRAEGFAKAERRLVLSGPVARAGVVMLSRLGATGRLEAGAGGTIEGGGVRVTVPAGAFGEATSVSAALIALGDPLLDELRLPLAIPSSRVVPTAPLFGLALDAEGRQPRAPLEVRVASSAGLPEGAAVPVGRYDPAAGAWVDVGVAVAGADGSLRFTVDHLSTFAGALPAVPTGDARPPELDGLSRVPTPFVRGEPRVDPRSGALQVGLDLPALTRRGERVFLTLFHDSRTPKARVSAPIAAPAARPGDGFVVQASSVVGEYRAAVEAAPDVSDATPAVVVADLEAREASTPAEATPVHTGTYDVSLSLTEQVDGALHASESRSFTQPKRGAALQAGGAPVSTRIALRSTALEPVAVDDRSQSAFGPGWHLRGLTRLVQPQCSDTRATLAGGYETPAIAFAPSGELYLSRVEQVLVAAGAPAEALSQPPLLAWSGGALYVGLQLADHAEVWRLARGEAARVIGDGLAAPAVSTCVGPAAAQSLRILTGLSAEPGGEGVLYANEDCILHLEPDGSTRLIAGNKQGVEVGEVPGEGVTLEQVNFGQEVERFVAGSAPGLYFLDSWLHGVFLVRDGTFAPLRTRVTHPHGLLVAFSPSGEFFYSAPGSPCLYRYDDGDNDPEVFPTCLQGYPTELEDGPAELARVGQLEAMAFDAAGNLWMVDSTFKALRRLASDGTVSTVAGGRAGDLSGVGGPAGEAALGALFTLAVKGPTELAAGGVGVILQLELPAGDALQGLGAGDGSLLTRNPNGTWQRVLADGLEERYDARGLLVHRGRPGEPGLDYVYGPWSGNVDEERCGEPPAPPLLQRLELAGEPLFTFSWDQGRLTEVNDAAGRRTSVRWAGGQVTALLPPESEVAFEYDSDGRLTARRSPGPAGTPVVWSYAYEQGRLVSAQVPGRGTLSFVSAEGASSISRDRFSAAGVARQVVAAPATSTLPTRAGGTVRVGLGADAVRITDPEGNPIELRMDAWGRLIREARADGTALALTRDPAGRLLELFNEQTSDRWRYVYDGAGRLEQRLDPAGRMTRWIYDGAGRVSFRHEPGENRQAFLYATSGAAEGLPTRVTDALGRVTSIDYDLRGNAVKYTAPDGTVTDLARDAAGRVVGLTEPSGLTQQTASDARDGVTSQTTGPAELGEVVAYRRVLADGWESEGSHVPASALLEATDGEGRAWRFTRDAAFQPAEFQTPGEGLVRQRFDEQGRRLRRETEDGSAEVFTWSPEGRLRERSFTGPAAGASVQFTYDALGRVARLADPLLTESRLFAPGLGWQQVTISPNAELGEPARFTLYRGRTSHAVETQMLGATRFLVHKAHDGQVDRVELEQTAVANSARDVLVFSFDASRKLTSLVRGNGTTTRRAYDAAGRPTEQVEQTPGGTTTLAWTYDAAGRVATRAINGVTQTYAYDARGRLASCGGSGESFTYDKTGARTSAGASLYQRDERGRLTSDGASDYTWDALGRRTSWASKTDATDRHELRYGPGGLLAEVRRGPPGATVPVASYRYDGSGRRVRATTTAGSSYTGYLPESDRPVRVVEPDGTEWHLVHAWKSAPFTMAVSPAGAERYVHLDPYERVVGVSDQAGALTLLDEDCFGRRLAPAPLTGPQVGFHGLQYDPETGLYAAGGRTYDPRVGELLSPDPRGLEAGVDPWSYGGGNPILRADPSGRIFFVFAGAVLAGALIANEIRSFAQSAEVKRARQSYEDMTEVDRDDKLESAENAHKNLHKASDKGGDTAIKCTRKGFESVLNPSTDASSFADQVKSELEDALEEAMGDTPEEDAAAPDA